MGWFYIRRRGEENEKENIQRKGGRQLQKKKTEYDEEREERKYALNVWIRYVK